MLFIPGSWHAKKQFFWFVVSGNNGVEAAREHKSSVTLQPCSPPPGLFWEFAKVLVSVQTHLFFIFHVASKVTGWKSCFEPEEHNRAADALFCLRALPFFPCLWWHWATVPNTRQSWGLTAESMDEKLAPRPESLSRHSGNEATNHRAPRAHSHIIGML